MYRNVCLVSRKFLYLYLEFRFFKWICCFQFPICEQHRKTFHLPRRSPVLFRPSHLPRFRRYYTPQSLLGHSCIATFLMLQQLPLPYFRFLFLQHLFYNDSPAVEFVNDICFLPYVNVIVTGPIPRGILHLIGSDNLGFWTYKLVYMIWVGNYHIVPTITISQK